MATVTESRRHVNPVPSRDTYLVELRDDGERTRVEGIVGDERDVLLDDYELAERGKSRRFERRRFVPLAADRRFEVARASWESATAAATFVAAMRLSRDSEFEAAREERDRLFDEARRLRSEYQRASSLVAVPGSGYAGGEFDVAPGERWPLTRREAFSLAAKWNRKALADNKSDGGWNVVVELGEPIPAGFCEMTISRNGVGSLARGLSYPCRVVEPTADELARYAIPAGAEKGGDA